MHYCQFCNQQFTAKSSLNTHQKTAKYCLDLQKKEPKNLNFSCDFCNKNFTTNSNLVRHIETCKYKKELKEIQIENNLENLEKSYQELQNKNLVLENNIKHYQEQLNDRNIKIEKLENALIGIAESKNEIMNDCIDSQIEKLTNKYGKKQRRKQITEPNVIYIVTTEFLKKERRYILGKSKNLTSRLSTYNKSDEHEIIYYQGCGAESNMDIIERMVLNKLEKYREVENRDRFILPENKDINFFIDIIKKNINFILVEEESD
jgi:uncharacterized Zn-finger protein